MVFDSILGNWTFERVVTPHASARGKAEIHLTTAGEALYRETAEIRLATGEVLNATQSYLYRRTEYGFDIFFADTGRLFQSLQFEREGSELRASAEHLCAADHYASDYVLSPPDRMFVRHIVRGPAKDYVSETKYERVR